KVRWYTRRATDYTDLYGPVLSPHVKTNLAAERCILDGEVS
ncbi:unnamed protein product, partial [Discosporangium mesarthrocarpum]